jgi:predicted O-linked N-acetylglucosamine transferase (SPINDLY family)
MTANVPCYLSRLIYLPGAYMSVTLENILLDDCWQAGVDRVLAGQEEEAQAIWLAPFFENQLLADTNAAINEEQLSQSLINYLLKAVDDRVLEGKLRDAYAIAKCLQTVAPENVNSLLRLVNISIQLNEFSLAALVDGSFIELFEQASDIDIDLLYIFITGITKRLEEEYATAYLDFIKLVADKTTDTQRFVYEIASHTYFIGKNLGLVHLRTKVLEVCLAYAPSNFRFIVLCDLAESTIQEKDYNKIMLVGEQCYQESQQLDDSQQICGSHRLLTALMEAGEWQRVPAMAKQHQQLIQAFLAKENIIITDVTIINSSYFLNYVHDEPKLLHHLRDAMGDICSKLVNSAQRSSSRNNHYQSPPKTKALRIGYIASTLGSHSVGWLSRWLFNYHDRSNFEIFIYHVGQKDNQNFNRKFFRDKVDVAHYLDGKSFEIADLIRRDEIDILIDMDSLSLSTTYEVMCHKPAPVSATWLGWDTSGCPDIDYFIADPYVLPPDAEEYYRTKIWRLPQTYLAIDGFEIQVPTKRRSDYQIPENAVVYLCAQKSYKHHPDILRLQMQIIKQVPNSYLLVKMRANPESLMKIYQELADEVGISIEQLRFIEPDPDEVTHRANLQLADVVLDTFPYNGATTTLETLWMGVPMVTKVGQAFVARNSYAFMQNVGVTEGIAHTDAEYVDWGVRLGTDLALRQQVMGKLLHSRKTSPLWNARSFTLEMENAYRQMWEIYQSQQK